METSRSVPSNLYASIRTFVPIQNSASVQSHLSATSSQQRIRNPTHVPATKKEPLLEDADIEANCPQVSTSVFSTVCALVTPELQILVRKLTLRRWLRWLLALYVLISVAFLSTRFLHVPSPTYHFSLWQPVRHRVSHTFPHVDALPIDDALTKLTSIFPEPISFLPNVLKADFQLDTVTACLWTSELEMDVLAGWMAKWPGLVSLLVVTKSEPNTAESKQLSHTISLLHHQFPRADWLSLHVLQVDPRAPSNPNAFLNLARMLSPTPRVALFPGNLSVVPTKALYRSYFSEASSSAKNTSHRPMVFTSRGHTSYPFSALAPAVLNRDDPLWCTERFFPSLSREMDWSECMWQIWLEHFGDIDIKQTTDWVRGVSPPPEPTSMLSKVRRRLSAKYRSETCMLATRQLAGLKTPERRAADAKKSRWLKRNCREWMTLA